MVIRKHGVIGGLFKPSKQQVKSHKTKETKIKQNKKSSPVPVIFSSHKELDNTLKISKVELAEEPEIKTEEIQVEQVEQIETFKVTEERKEELISLLDSMTLNEVESCLEEKPKKKRRRKKKKYTMEDLEPIEVSELTQSEYLA